jgi:hypothetical protein
MPHSSYPSDTDIQTFVADTGITLPDNFSFAGYGAAASAGWEQRTGWQPFLKDSVATARRYNPPGSQPSNRTWSGAQYGGGRILNLYAGIPTEADLTSIVSNGTPLVLNTNFFMQPTNNPNIGRPYTRAEMVVPLWGTVNSVVVTAKWGWSAIIPEDAWQAILRIGANIAAGDLLEAILLSPNSIKDGDTTVTQDNSKLAMEKDSWARYADNVVGRYMFTNQGIL